MEFLSAILLEVYPQGQTENHGKLLHQGEMSKQKGAREKNELLYSFQRPRTTEVLDEQCYGKRRR